MRHSTLPCQSSIEIYNWICINSCMSCDLNKNWFKTAHDRKQKATANLVISVCQVLHLATQDLDVGRPQQKHSKSANHLPAQLQLRTGPAGIISFLQTRYNGFTHSCFFIHYRMVVTRQKCVCKIVFNVFTF